MSAALADIPQAISVYNEQFLRDIAVEDAEKLADYFIGTQTNGASANEGKFTFRGFEAGETQQSLNGFLMTRGAKDNYNVDRAELIMGPASVIYGNAQPGGLTNTLTKRAIFGKTFADLSLQVASFDIRRTTLDTNTSRGPFAIRFNALYQNGDGFIDWQTREKQFFHLSTSFQLGRSTVFRLEGEYADMNEVRSDNYMGFRRPDLYARLFIDEVIVPRSKSGGWTGPDSRTHAFTKFGAAYLEHRFNDKWTFEAAYAAQTENTDDVLATNSNNLLQNATLGYYVQTNWLSRARRQPLVEYRVSSTYDLDLGWTRQRLIAQYDHLTEKLRNPAVREFRKAVAGTAGNAQFTRTLPLSLGNGAAQTAYRPDPTAEWRYTGTTWQDHITEMFYASAFGEYFGGRLRSLVGLRYTAYTNKTYTVTHFGGIHTYRKPGMPIVWDDSPESYRIDGVQNLEYHNLSPSAGVVFRATKSTDLFLNYSTAFARQASNRLARPGEILDPELGLGWEGGVRLNLLRDRLNVSASVFSNVKENAAEQIPVAQLPPELVGLGTFYEPGITAKSEGFEVQVIGNPLPGWTLRGGYGYVDAYRTASKFTPATVGQPPDGLVHHTANFHSVYDVRDGGLKGFRFGGGAVFKDKVRPTATINWDNPSAVLVNAFLGYSRKFPSCTWSIQLNVNNVTDAVYLNRYRFIDPRTYAVTNRIRF
jgi:iron complex outermembrane receptor protein